MLAIADVGLNANTTLATLEEREELPMSVVVGEADTGPHLTSPIEQPQMKEIREQINPVLKLSEVNKLESLLWTYQECFTLHADD